MSISFALAGTLTGLVWSIQATAINVFACEPEWAALVTELAGDRAQIYVATTAQQDPHFIQARPSLISQVRRANLLICSGAELEIGWLPLLLRRAGNRQIQPGQDGHFLAAEHVQRLEVPTQLDRSQGDVHSQGNPHVHLDPRNIEHIAKALAARLARIDSEGAAIYRQRSSDFLTRWTTARQSWLAKTSTMHGQQLIAHHSSFSYLANWLGLEIVANIEVKPGIAPSTAHLAQLLDRFATHKPRAIVRTPYADAKPSLWLAERLAIPASTLPYTVGDEAADLFALFDMTIARLAELFE